MTGSPQAVSISPSSLWIAAGLDISSFDIINTRILVTVNIGTSFELGILGRSVLMLPPSDGTTGITDAFVYAELDIESTYDPSDGVFDIQATLTPNSFVFNSNCCLSGGFAMFHWFGSNPNATDFVVTLGGYHPSFTPPSYYPTVPRVEFSWQIDQTMSASGNGYFAVVPSEAMAGAEYNLQYSDDIINAWIKIDANGYVQWSPFHYHVEAGASGGASITIGSGVFSQTWSVEVSADVIIYGPPIGGEATIDTCVYDCTVNFGTTPEEQTPIMWKALSDNLPTTTSGTTTTTQYITIKADKGVIPDTTTNMQSNGTTTPTTWFIKLS